MNIYDISKKTGVSIATVSRVINGNSNVSEKTRAKVMEAIDEYGYTPNVFARGLGLNTMKTIGIMCADSSDPYFAKAIYYIEQELRKNGYDSLLSCTGYDHENKQKCIRLLLSKRVDAVILVGSNYVEPEPEMNNYILEVAKKTPVMLVNGVLNSDNIYSTVCDDHAAIYEVTSRFIKSGKDKPCYIYNSHSYSGMKKLSGFCDAMKDAGLKVSDENCYFIDTLGMSVSATKNIISGILDKNNDYNGIIAADDVIAAGFIKYAHQKGLSIPDDVFVAGYNNFDIAECCEPELTSVDNKLESICKQCVSTLMNVFSDEKSAPKSTVFSAEIIERSSTKFIQ